MVLRITSIHASCAVFFLTSLRLSTFALFTVSLIFYFHSLIFIFIFHVGRFGEKYPVRFREWGVRHFDRQPPLSQCCDPDRQGDNPTQGASHLFSHLEVPHKCQSRLDGTCDDAWRKDPRVPLGPLWVERFGDKEATEKTELQCGIEDRKWTSPVFVGMKVPVETWDICHLDGVTS